MLEKLREIDTSAIEKLIKIKEEQDRLVGFQRKADDIKDTVDDTIYRRVRADYEGRNSALEKEATPLKDEARAEYEKLCSIFDQLKQALDQALGVKQELEFRHAVEEFDKTKLAEKLEEPERVIEQCRSQLGDADTLKARFFAAFHSEEDLKLESGLQPEVAAESQTEVESNSHPKVAAENQPELDSSSDPKVDREGQLESQSKAEFEPLELEPKQPASRPSSSKTSVRPTPAAPEGTSGVLQAQLIMVSEGEPSETYTLGVLNYIGRAEDNHVRIMSPTVSRKHALVTVSSTGFTLKDLESRSGTFVNSEQVTECSLANEDRVKLGDVELIFRSL